MACMDAASLHDQRYQQLKVQGGSGWNGPDIQSKVADHWTCRLEMAGIEEGDSVLELGCGAGCVSIELARKGYRVTGIDHSATAIQWAREKAAKAGPDTLDIVLGDVSELPFPDSSFSVCIDAHCLHCLPQGPLRRRFFAECWRVLRPGGLLFIHSMCGEPLPAHWPKLNYHPQERQTFIEDVPMRQYLEPHEVMAEARAAGFLITSCRVERKTSEEEDDMVLIDARKTVVQEH